MDPLTAINALFGLLALTGLVVLWKGPLQSFATDCARNAMFAQRDRLFDLAADGKLKFDDPVYQRIRESINIDIRFAHHLDLAAILLVIRPLQTEPLPTKPSAVHIAVAEIEDHEVREIAGQIVNHVETWTLRLMLFRSPVICTIGLLRITRLRLIFRDSNSDTVAQGVLGRLLPYADLIEREAKAA